MELEAFVDQMIAEKGLDSEGPDVTAEIRTDLLDRLEGRINRMILETLPSEQLEPFEAAIDSGSDAVIQGFLKKHIPDLDSRVAVVLVHFRTNYI